MAKILVADDESRIRKLVGDFLKKSGYEIVEAVDGRDAVEKFKTENDINLVVCDIMMPEMDGWEVCKEIRKTSNVPIIVLTARTQEFDELVSFESGADDFVTKPFSPTILVKRIEAQLKHAESPVTRSTSDIISIDNLVLDIPGHTISLSGRELELTIKEFNILEILMKNPGRLYSRDMLLDIVWGDNFFGDSRTVDSHVARLRTKLGPWGEEHLKTVYGAGYKIEVKKN